MDGGFYLIIDFTACPHDYTVNSIRLNIIAPLCLIYSPYFIRKPILRPAPRSMVCSSF